MDNVSLRVAAVLFVLRKRYRIRNNYVVNDLASAPWNASQAERFAPVMCSFLLNEVDF